MSARIVPARHGGLWFLHGWRLFKAAPVGWLGIIVVYWVAMSVLSAVPLAGVALASMAVPAFAVGFMAAARAAEQRQPVRLPVLFEGFRANLRDQLILGLAYFASLALILSLTSMVDGGALAKWMTGGGRPSEDALQSEEFLTGMLVAAGLYTPVMMAFWFAPPLAAWHPGGPAKALFFSFFGCLLNWRAFLAYGAWVALFSFVIPFVIMTGLLLASGGKMKLPVAGLVLPLVLVLLPTLFASFYASYRDIFLEGDAADAKSKESSGTE